VLLGANTQVWLQREKIRKEDHHVCQEACENRVLVPRDSDVRIGVEQCGSSRQDDSYKTPGINQFNMTSVLNQLADTQLLPCHICLQRGTGCRLGHLHLGYAGRDHGWQFFLYFTTSVGGINKSAQTPNICSFKCHCFAAVTLDPTLYRMAIRTTRIRRCRAIRTPPVFRATRECWAPKMSHGEVWEVRCGRE